MIMSRKKSSIRLCVASWCLGALTHLLYLMMFGSLAIGISTTIAGPFSYRGYPEVGLAFSGVFASIVYLHSTLALIIVVATFVRLGNKTKLAFVYIFLNLCFCCSMYAGYNRMRPLMLNNYAEIIRFEASEMEQIRDATQLLLENGFQVSSYEAEDGRLVLSITLKDGYDADHARSLLEEKD